MAVMYFSVIEDVTDQYVKGYVPAITRLSISHAQVSYVYDEEHLTAKYGYPTQKRCEQEMRKIRKWLDKSEKESNRHYLTRCEAHEVPDPPVAGSEE